MTAPLEFQLIEVKATRLITPHMARITFVGPDLHRFVSVSPDQQVKLFFSRTDGDPEVPPRPEDGDIMTWHRAYLAMPDDIRPWLRAYTIRAHRPDVAEIDIDFVLHGDEGPASAWAGQARPGQVLGMLGPSPSHHATVGEHDWQLLVGDETALPAIAANLEALPDGARALAYIEVPNADEEQDLVTSAGIRVRWIHRDDRRPGALLDALRASDLPDGRGFAWIAGEAGMVREVRRHLVNERGIDKKAIAFTGYWRRNLTQDAAPTADDVADVQEAQAAAVG